MQNMETPARGRVEIERARQSFRTAPTNLQKVCFVRLWQPCTRAFSVKQLYIFAQRGWCSSQHKIMQRQRSACQMTMLQCPHCRIQLQTA